MRKKTLKIIMSTLVIVVGVILLLFATIGYCISILLQVDPVVVAAGASEEQRLGAVRHWLDEQFDKHKFNGGVLIVRDGQVLLSKTCGYTDHTATQRLDDHTAFRLASVSKQFTAAGILRLAEMGSLSLDDPLVKHFKEFISDEVTIRHLLNQTSGISDVYMDLAEQHREKLRETLTITDVVHLVRQYGEMKRQPGDEMEYSNTNYVLLAGIIELVSGRSFEKFMHEELFQPLGMKDTRVWNLLSTGRSLNQAGDFDQDGEDRTSVEPTWIDGVAGDGAVFCSLHDMVIWDQFWKGNPLISDELLMQAVRRPRLNNGTKSDYGFGWVLKRNSHWHNGAWLGAGTFFVRYPRSKCCLVVLDNSSNLRVDTIADHLLAALQPIFTKEE